MDTIAKRILVNMAINAVESEKLYTNKEEFWSQVVDKYEMYLVAHEKV